MKSLRSQVIRLAHEKPELQPYLLPLLKEAGLQFMPDNQVDFAFEGDTAAFEADVLGDAFYLAHDAINRNLKEQLKYVGDALRAVPANVDVNPKISRAALVNGFHDTFTNLDHLVEKYLTNLPKGK